MKNKLWNEHLSTWEARFTGSIDVIINHQNQIIKLKIPLAQSLEWWRLETTFKCELNLQLLSIFRFSMFFSLCISLSSLCASKMTLIQTFNEKSEWKWDRTYPWLHCWYNQDIAFPPHRTYIDLFLELFSMGLIWKIIDTIF